MSAPPPYDAINAPYNPNYVPQNAPYPTGDNKFQMPQPYVPPNPGYPQGYPPNQGYPNPVPPAQGYQNPTQPQQPYYPPGQAQHPQHTTVIVQGPPGVPIGGCPVCRVGHLDSRFTCCGICLAIFFFPIGILCCLCMTEKRCSNCNSAF